MKFADDYAKPLNLLERKPSPTEDKSDADKVALAAEAIRDISKVDLSNKFRLSRIKFVPECGKSNIVVNISGSIGSNAVIEWSKSDLNDLFSGKRSWEVELTLKIGADGMPGELFLERACGQSAIDRAVVRILMRPDVWRNAGVGNGSVLISFSPEILNGAVDEN
jgi:hypothetical protein